MLAGGATARCRHAASAPLLRQAAATCLGKIAWNYVKQGAPRARLAPLPPRRSVVVPVSRPGPCVLGCPALGRACLCPGRGRIAPRLPRGHHQQRARRPQPGRAPLWPRSLSPRPRPRPQGKRDPLVDLRFADDILLLADSTAHCVAMLRSFLDSLREVGLILNVSETKLLTTEAQPPDCIWLDGLRTQLIKGSPDPCVQWKAIDVMC